MSDRIQPLLQQIYESENLTDALTDEGASILLEWGERQLKAMDVLIDKQVDLESGFRQLRRVMQSVNRLIELKDTLTDEQLVQRALTMVERAMELAVEKHGAGKAPDFVESQNKLR